MEIKSTKIGPIAEQGQHLRTHHGITENDPWYWLDTKHGDPNHATVQELVALENKWAEEKIAHTHPIREKIVAEIRALTKETDVSAPVKHGNYWYFTRTFEGIDYPRLCRVKSNDVPTVNAETTHENEEIILDQAKCAEGQEFYSVANQVIDVEGNRFIWGEDTTGGELYDLRVMEFATGEIIDDAVKQVGYSLAVVGEDLYYTRVDDVWRAHQIWVHRIGTDAAEDELVFEEPDEKFEIYVSKSRDNQWVIIGSYATLSTRIWLFPADGKRRAPRQLTTPKEGLRYSVEPAGNHLLINHNLVSEDETLAIVPTPSIEQFEGTSLEQPLCPEETWVENWTLVEGERLLEVYAFEKFAAFAMRANGQTAIRIWVRSQAYQGEDVPLDETAVKSLYNESFSIEWPQAVRVIEPASNPEWDTNSFRFTVQSFAQPPITAEYVLTSDSSEGGQINVIKELQVPGFDPTQYETRLEWVEARDGVKVPVSMVYRKDLCADRTNPGLIYGYGSYEASMDPWFSINRITLLNRGLVYAMAHIRGGGELGRNWYEQGKFAVKTNTFNDFVDVSRWLVDSGWVASGRLAAQGGSAGGLLMGGIANQAPELYRVVDAHVPFVDALTTILDPSKPTHNRRMG